MRASSPSPFRYSSGTLSSLSLGCGLGLAKKQNRKFCSKITGGKPCPPLCLCHLFLVLIILRQWQKSSSFYWEHFSFLKFPQLHFPLPESLRFSTVFCFYHFFFFGGYDLFCIYFSQSSVHYPLPRSDLVHPTTHNTKILV